MPRIKILRQTPKTKLEGQFEQVCTTRNLILSKILLDCCDLGDAFHQNNQTANYRSHDRPRNKAFRNDKTERWTPKTPQSFYSPIREAVPETQKAFLLRSYHRKIVHLKNLLLTSETPGLPRKSSSFTSNPFLSISQVDQKCRKQSSTAPLRWVVRRRVSPTPTSDPPSAPGISRVRLAAQRRTPLR